MALVQPTISAISSQEKPWMSRRVRTALYFGGRRSSDWWTRARVSVRSPVSAGSRGPGSASPPIPSMSTVFPWESLRMRSMHRLTVIW